MHTPSHILIVDDDPDLRTLLSRYLEEQDFQVTTVEDGEKMDDFFQRGKKADLMILDLMLPGEGGLSIATRLRGSNNIPIIILSARGDEVDRIVGLEMGADDYLPKPFSPRELLARIRAVLRRPAAQSSDVEIEEHIRSFGPYQLNLESHTLSSEDRDIPLTGGEYDLLKILLQHPRRCNGLLPLH